MCSYFTTVKHALNLHITCMKSFVNSKDPDKGNWKKTTTLQAWNMQYLKSPLIMHLDTKMGSERDKYDTK